MIALVFINNLGVCPYVDKYIDVLKQNNVEFEVIIWDRSWQEGKTYIPECKHVFKKVSRENASPLAKARHFFQYRKFVNKVFKQNKYDKVIFLSTLSAFMLSKKYRKKMDYVLDYRDASYEKKVIFNYFFKKIVKNAKLVPISSKGFLEILPKNANYIMAHNFRYHDLDYRQEKMSRSYVESRPIEVSYVGLVRNVEYIKTLIDIFGNDNRFILNLNGRIVEYPNLIDYAKGKDNVIITGDYNNDEKYNYILAADFVTHNFPASFNHKLAILNKFYDGMIYKKPLLGNIESYSGQLIENQKMGISLNFGDPEYKEKIIDYYKNLNTEDFEKNAEELLKRVIEEDSAYLEEIKKFVISC